MVATFAGYLEILTPLRGDIQAMTGEIAALCDDLAALRSQSSEAGAASSQRTQARFDGMGQKVGETRGNIDALMQAPGRRIDDAIEKTNTTTADKLTRAINGIRDCGPAG